MIQRLNEYGQPIGPPVPDWRERDAPPRTPMHGRFARVEPLDPARHAAGLYAAFAEATDGQDWTYMNAGPFSSAAEYEAYAQRMAASSDPLHHAIVDVRSDRPLGTAALMRIDRPNGVIEIGWISYSPRLKRSTVATEAMYLFMRRVFDELGYRRFEWKCDALNERSRAAALRYGFVYEGIFRNAVVYKGRSRDTAWFSIIDAEWPRLRDAYEAWLAPSNFAADGRQRRRLAEFIAP